MTTLSCDATQQYAKTSTQANQRLIGSWRLVSVSAGFGQAPSVPNQVITFDTAGGCLIRQDGQEYGPFAYAIGLTSSFANPAVLIPQLTVNDSTRLNSAFIRVGRGQLYICEQEFVTDYGSAFDGPTHLYRRQWD